MKKLVQELLLILMMTSSSLVLAAQQEYQLSIKGHSSTTEVQLSSDETGQTGINHNGKTIHDPKYSVTLNKQETQEFYLFGYGDESHFNLNVQTKNCGETKVIMLTTQEFIFCDTQFLLRKIADAELIDF